VVTVVMRVVGKWETAVVDEAAVGQRVMVRICDVVFVRDGGGSYDVPRHDAAVHPVHLLVDRWNLAKPVVLPEFV